MMWKSTHDIILSDKKVLNYIHSMIHFYRWDEGKKEERKIGEAQSRNEGGREGKSKNQKNTLKWFFDYIKLNN